MRFRRGARSDSGMTLPEVMIASSILLVCLTSLAGLLAGAVNSSSSARMRDEAANLANARIEAARSLAYDHVGVRFSNGVKGDPAGDILTPETVGAFVVATDCRWIRTTTGRAAYKQITVTVAWQQPTAGQVQVTTIIYGKSNIVTSGDLDVRLRYREDASPVVNAAVAIRAADNSARSVSTDASGEAFFGQVAIGSVALQVTPPAGYIVDTSTMSSVTVAADAVSTVIVYVQQPAQSTVHVSDTSGASVPGASVSLRRTDGSMTPTTTTDADGNAVFTQLLYSDYTASVSKVGYSSASAPFTLSPGAASPTVPLAIGQLLGVGMHVRVFDTNGTQVPAGTVTVRNDTNTTVLQQGVAATNGEISFAGLSAGTYDVTVDKASYVSRMIPLTLHDGDVGTLDFHMVPVASNGNMQITTYDKYGHAGGLRVIVSGGGYYRNDLWSDTSGKLTLTGLVPGSYSVQCYTKAASTATVIVNAGQTASVAISQRW